MVICVSLQLVLVLYYTVIIPDVVRHSRVEQRKTHRYCVSQIHIPVVFVRHGQYGHQLPVFMIAATLKESWGKW